MEAAVTCRQSEGSKLGERLGDQCWKTECCIHIWEKQDKDAGYLLEMKRLSKRLVLYNLGSKLTADIISGEDIKRISDTKRALEKTREFLNNIMCH